jgi:hypothetical protein
MLRAAPSYAASGRIFFPTGRNDSNISRTFGCNAVISPNFILKINGAGARR